MEIVEYAKETEKLRGRPEAVEKEREEEQTKTKADAVDQGVESPTFMLVEVWGEVERNQSLSTFETSGRTEMAPFNGTPAAEPISIV